MAKATIRYGLNPRFDGAFLNLLSAPIRRARGCLNPRFDGAFLNYKLQNVSDSAKQVLIPDLMGLF